VKTTSRARPPPWTTRLSLGQQSPTEKQHC
jgi:hypothetical protein